MSRQRPERSGGRRQEGRDAAALEQAATQAAAAAKRAIEASARRFARAVGDDAAGGAAPGDEEVVRRLRDEPLAGMGRVTYSSNAVFLLELAGADPGDPGEPLRAIYKPARGERPLWDFPRHTLHLREVAAYLVSAAIGDGLVPPTTLRDGPHGPGSVQLFIRSAAEGTQLEAESLSVQLAALAALDVLINNADRKSDHLLLGDNGRLRGIDNALSFLPYPRQRTVLLDLGGRPVPAAAAERLSRLVADEPRRAALAQRLRLLLDAEEVDSFEQRLDRLAAERTYPVLDPWDGRPFEWW